MVGSNLKHHAASRDFAQKRNKIVVMFQISGTMFATDNTLSDVLVQDSQKLLDRRQQIVAFPRKHQFDDMGHFLQTDNSDVRISLHLVFGKSLIEL